MEDIFETNKKLDLHHYEYENTYYLIMNNKDNKFTIPWIREFNSLLDKVEEMTEEGHPGCLVTVSTSEKVFHTGFDLETWKDDHI